MSRLARSCRDWHQLLELCGLFHTLLADPDGLYDPTDHNDRLLLGLSGIMSEAELHILRGRMLAGARNKARRGELFNHAPIGYARVPGGGLMLDPDEQARDVVRLIFDKFDELGTVSALLRYLVRHGIRLGVPPPLRARQGRAGVAAAEPDDADLPACTTRSTPGPTAAAGGRPTPGGRSPGGPPPAAWSCRWSEWEVLIPDHLPGYITWERYEANLRRLAQNGARAGAMRAAREGDSLLAGLVVCGRCGRRMMVAYTGKEHRLRYSCQRGALDYAEPRLPEPGRAAPLDELVAGQVLLALEPAALELSLRAVGRRASGSGAGWTGSGEQRLERARYEAERAARQYQACEPENRLVGAGAGAAVGAGAAASSASAEDEYDRFRRGRPAELTSSRCEYDRVIGRATSRRCGGRRRRRLRTARRWCGTWSSGWWSRSRGRPSGSTWRSTGPAGSSAATRSAARCGGSSSCGTTRS